MYRDYKALRNALLGSLAALSMYACGGGGGSGDASTKTNPNPVVGDNYITSAYGTAKLEFKNGVVKTQNNALSGVYTQNNQGNVVVYLPHTGGNFALTANNADDPSTYVYAVSNGTNLCNDTSFSIVSTNASCVNVSGSDYANNQTFTNEPMIKINHAQATETATFNIQGSEGQTKTISVFRLYDLIQQGNNVVLNLGDFFQSFTIQFNDMTNAAVVSDATCPAFDDGSGNVRVPYNATCLKIKLEDVDTIGSNHQYSLDRGTTWQTFTSPYTLQLDVSGLAPGSSQNIRVEVKEKIGTANGNDVWDSISYVWNVIKDSQPGINAYCVDNVSGNTWNVNSGDTCVFSDPQGNTGIQYAVKITLNDTGTCNVVVYKDGTQVDNQTVSCANLQYSYGIDASEKGTGVHSVSIEVYRTDYGSPVLIGNVNVNYRVNAAPTLSFFFQPTLMKDGSTAYKYYVNETINGSIQGFYGSVTNTSLTCYLDFNNDGTPDQTINNCENAQNFTVSYPSPGTYTIKATVTDGVNSSTATQTVSVYDYPAIVASWDPGLIFLGGSSTFSVYVINTGIVDDNVSECLLTVDLHCDGYINTTINGCSTGVVYSITDTPPIDGTRTDCAEFEDYRGTKVSGSATLIVLP